MFASPTLARYLIKLFFTRTFAVLAVLMLILQVLDLLSESDAILKHAGNGQAEIWTYVTLRLPQILQRFLPFCALLGTLISLYTLNQHSEVVAMKAGGMSAHQVLAPLLLASGVVAIAAFAFNERVVTRATAMLDGWQATGFATMPTGREALANVWVRDGEHLLHVDTVNGRGAATRLTGVTLVERAGGRLTGTTTADRGAPVAGGGWLLPRARHFDVRTAAVTNATGVVIARGVTPEQLTLANVSADGTAFGPLRRAIDDLARAGRPTGALEGAYWHKLSGPLSTLLMPLLASVAAFGLARSGKLFVRAVIGMALGLAYYVADNFAMAMGDLGAYPPLVAAWAPFVLFLMIGEAVLVRTEE
jgi:lipopolysaccharide export system permease protein